MQPQSNTPDELLQCEETEAWRPVVCGYYEVSNIGRVRRVHPGCGARVGRLLTPMLTHKGYYAVVPHIDGKRRPRLVHGLVAEAFMGPCPVGLQVNHKDGNKWNNLPENLEYVTPGENQKHAYALGLVNPPAGELNGRAKLSKADVHAIRNSGDFSPILAQRYGVTRWTIWDIRTYRTWKHI